MTLPSVLTLNLSRPTNTRAKALLDYLWHREEDLLILTETAPGSGSALMDSVCRGAGHSVLSSLTDATGRRRAGVGASSHRPARERAGSRGQRAAGRGWRAHR